MENALIKPTALEQLALRYRAEHQRQESRNDVTRRIKFAYTFLRNLGKPHSIMTMEELNIASAHLRELSEQKIKKLQEKLDKTFRIRFMRRLRLKRDIKKQEYILEYGYNRNLSDDTFYGQSENYPDVNPLNLKELVETIFQQQFKREK